MPLTPRARLVAEIVARATGSVEDVTDFPAFRRRRTLWRQSRPARIVAGTSDRRARLDEIEIALSGHTQRALVHRPPAAGGARPVLVNFHGGGWVAGSPEESRWAASRIAVQTGAVVISPSYRLAPEHPFPAAVDDAWHSLRWVVENAGRLGVDPSRIAVMGDGAGGNLAAVVALLARDAGAPMLAGQVLVHPIIELSRDLEESSPTTRGLTRASLQACIELYLADAYGTRDIRASPLHAPSLAGLPPALIVTIGRGQVHDEGVRYRRELVSAGVPVQYQHHPDAIHGFLGLPGASASAASALTEIVRWLGRHLVTPGPRGGRGRERER